MRCFFGRASPSAFFLFFGPLPLLPLPPDLDLPLVDENGALLGPDAAEEGPAEAAEAPCRALRTNLSTIRKVRGSSMSTFSST